MQIINSIKIEAQVNTLWKILADDFSDISQWTSLVNTSSDNPELPKGGGRTCQLHDGAVAHETLTDVNPSRHSFTHEVKLSRMPFFMKSMKNTWRIEANGKNQSTVTFEINVKLLPVFAQVMGPLMKMQFNKLANTIFEELKCFAESGKIHPRKHEHIKAKSINAA